MRADRQPAGDHHGGRACGELGSIHSVSVDGHGDKGIGHQCWNAGLRVNVCIHIGDGCVAARQYDVGFRLADVDKYAGVSTVPAPRCDGLSSIAIHILSSGVRSGFERR